MSATAQGLQRLLKRDRAVVAGALALIVALAWGWLAAMALAMDQDPGAMAGEWTAGYFLAMFAMWAIMMAGMMLPSAAPAILLYGALCAHSRRPAARTLLFAAGYLLAWTAFSLAATAAQWALSSTALLSEAMASRSAVLTGTLFVAAGLYQLSPWKAACLLHCRAPAELIARRARSGPLGAVAMGLEHGAYCVGCCWALMALLFAFGVMNLLWIAALSAVVLAEKLFPIGAGTARAGAAATILLGLLVLLNP